MMRIAGRLAWWLILGVGIFILGSVLDTLIDPGIAGPVSADALQFLPR